MQTKNKYIFHVDSLPSHIIIIIIIIKNAHYYSDTIMKMLQGHFT